MERHTLHYHHIPTTNNIFLRGMNSFKVFCKIGIHLERAFDYSHCRILNITISVHINFTSAELTK